MPALLACMGLVIDYGVWVHQKQELQRIADEAAVAAASELYLANSSASQAEAVASSVAKSQSTAASMASAAAPVPAPTDRATAGSNGSGKQPMTFGGEIRVATNVDTDESSVEVTVRQTGESYFSGMFFPPPEIVVSAVARAAGGGRVCVIGLDEDAATTVSLVQSAQVTATRCAVYSNSTSSSGIDVSMSAKIDAELICSAGGTDGNSGNYAPEPTTDCPKIQDPLANRPAPYVGSCDHHDLEIMKETVTLRPGVYCGGLTIMSNSEVKMAEGIYVMKDGPLIVTSNSVVYGEYVGVYLTGDNAVFAFESQSDIDFTAPRDGPMAGILFFEDRDAPLMRRHVIMSQKADNLLGTIYLPSGVFVVATNNKVADQSAYTAVVARRIELSKKPNLYLNADYGSTDVPVPSGIGQVGGNIFLAK